MLSSPEATVYPAVARTVLILGACSILTSQTDRPARVSSYSLISRGSTKLEEAQIYTASSQFLQS